MYRAILVDSKLKPLYRNGHSKKRLRKFFIIKNFLSLFLDYYSYVARELSKVPQIQGLDSYAGMM